MDIIIIILSSLAILMGLVNLILILKLKKISLENLKDDGRDEKLLSAFQTAFESLDKTTKERLDNVKESGETRSKNLEDRVARELDTFKKFSGETLFSLERNTEKTLVSQGNLMKASLESLTEKNQEKISNLTKTTEATLSLQTKIMAEKFEEIRNNFKSFTEQSESKMEILRTSVEGNLKRINEENKSELEKMRQVVDEKMTETLEKRLTTSFAVIEKSLSEVYKGLGDMQSISKGVGDLKNVLQNVKIRGTWAEIQLENLLSQILIPSQFARQFKISPTSDERVDFAILLPGKDNQVVIPIDSKFPREEFERLITASEVGDIPKIEECQKRFETVLKVQAKSISQKYIVPPYTTDFAIMYLPLEGLYAEVLRKADLPELLQREYRVVVAGPSTLGAMLNSLQMGFKSLEIEKRSSEIYALLGIFKKEFEKFSTYLEKTQKKIGEAGAQLDLATRKTRTIERKLRDVQGEKPLVELEEQDETSL